jgi:uncharacterized protein YaaQ
MKLLISVINRDDVDPLIDALVSDGYRATVISTTGGFLREGNATLLIGVTDDSVSAVLGIIRANCRARTRYVSPWPPAVEGEKLHLPTSIEVQVGGAVVFIADMERFERF